MVQYDWRTEYHKGEMVDDVTHCSRDSELPVVKAEVHDRFRVSAYYTAASIRREPVEHRRTYVFVLGRTGGSRDSPETPITRILFVDGSSFTFDTFRKQLE